MDDSAIIQALLARCSPDERKVVRVLLERIDRARPHYGPLDVATDRRDWRAEKAAEKADWIVYDAIEEVARGLR